MLRTDARDARYVNPHTGCDTSYAAEPRLRPFPRENLNFSKRIFNYRLSRWRRVSENAFGIYTQQWRVFQRPFQCSLTLTDKVIKASAVLHNFLRSSVYTQTSEYIPVTAPDNDSSNALSRMRNIGNNSTRDA